MYKQKLPKEVKQGHIYMAVIPEGYGSCQHGIRPVVVTQCNIANRNSTTHMCAIITSQLKKRELPTHVVLPENIGLERKSMVAVEQSFPVDDEQLLEFIGMVPKETYKKIDKAIRANKKTEYSSYNKDVVCAVRFKNAHRRKKRR